MGRIIREFGVVMYPLLYLKWITNKDYCIIQEPAQCYVATWMWGEFGRMNMCICMGKKDPTNLTVLLLHSGGWVSTLLSLNLISHLNFHFIFNWLQGISTRTFFSTFKYNISKMEFITHSPIHVYPSDIPNWTHFNQSPENFQQALIMISSSSLLVNMTL